MGISSLIILIIKCQDYDSTEGLLLSNLALCLLVHPNKAAEPISSYGSSRELSVIVQNHIRVSWLFFFFCICSLKSVPISFPVIQLLRICEGPGLVCLLKMGYKKHTKSDSQAANPIVTLKVFTKALDGNQDVKTQLSPSHMARDTPKKCKCPQL